MNTTAHDLGHTDTFPVRVHLDPKLENRNRLTVAFRPILALPHILLVGAPAAAVLSWWAEPNSRSSMDWGSAGGVLGAVAAVCALIAWFSIVFTGRYPRGLYQLAVFYLRWRVRVLAYIALLADEYPPFGEAEYRAGMIMDPQPEHRNRITVAFRLFLALPQIIIVWALSILWGLCTLAAWVAILFTGKYPAPLYSFSYAVLQWNVHLEAYLLLLEDEYPPVAVR